MNKSAERRHNALIMELCKINSYDRDKLEELLSSCPDKAYVLGQLMYHRMGAAAWYVLKESGLAGKVNREFRNSLRMVYDSSGKRSAGFRRMLTETAGILAGAPFPYAVLKGARLAYEYPAGLRTSNDLDILVRQEDIGALSDRLKGAGYIQGFIRDDTLVPATRSEILSSRLNRGETVPFVKQVDWEQMKFCEIDINFSLDFKAKRSSKPVELLLADIEPMEVDEGRTLMTLSAADFIIQLCAHLYKEAAVYQWVEMGRDLSIYKFCDIYLLLMKGMTDTLGQKLAQRIVSCGVEKECYYALSTTAQLFDIDSPALNRLLHVIQPANTAYIKEIIDPSRKKAYRYDMNFTDWVFCGDRSNNLQEVI